MAANWQPLLDFEPEPGRRYKLDEIGDLVGISKERIRQVEAAALRKLRRKLEQMGVDYEDLTFDNGEIAEYGTARNITDP